MEYLQFHSTYQLIIKKVSLTLNHAMFTLVQATLVPSTKTVFKICVAEKRFSIIFY